jgi:hypothetical protein
LVELSDYGMPPQVSDGLFKFQSAGVVPIITHPERNGILQRGPENVLEWVDAGCLVQVTSCAVTGFCGPVARRVGMWLLEHWDGQWLAGDDRCREVVFTWRMICCAQNEIAEEFGLLFSVEWVFDYRVRWNSLWSAHLD